MSISTKPEAERHMLYFATGITALSLRREHSIKKTIEGDLFKEYLKETERFILPSHLKNEEDRLNSSLQNLKNNMKSRKYVQAEEDAKNLHQQLKSVHDKV